MVSKTVVGFGIETPNPRRADIGQARAALGAQQPHPPQPPITDSGGIQSGSPGVAAASEVPTSLQDAHRIPESAGHHDGMEAGAWGGGERLRGDPALGGDVLALGTGMDGPYRHPPGAPPPPPRRPHPHPRRPGDMGLGGDEAGHEPAPGGLSPTRVLLSPPETPRGRAGLSAWTTPVRAPCDRLRPEHRPETAGPVGPERVPIVLGEQCMGEAGWRLDFQAQLWQIRSGATGQGPGHAGRVSWGLVECVEPGEGPPPGVGGGVEVLRRREVALRPNVRQPWGLAAGLACWIRGSPQWALWGDTPRGGGDALASIPRAEGVYARRSGPGAGGGLTSRRPAPGTRSGGAGGMSGSVGAPAGGDIPRP